MNSAMDVIWAKQKMKEIESNETMTDARASGDRRSCHICGSDRGLRPLAEPCGTGYDRLLHTCFGIAVEHPPNSMICERCARHLRGTERLKALVQAVFGNSSNYSDETSTTLTTIAQLTHTTDCNEPHFDDNSDTIKKLKRGSKKRVAVAKSIVGKQGMKKANIACCMCKQKYPMVVPIDGQEKFICSRCKKAGENNGKRLGLSVEINHAVRSQRLFGTPKKQLKRCDSVLKYHREPAKYECSQCSKRFILPIHLAAHLNTVHGEGLNTVCVVCDKEMKTRVMLERHMRNHTANQRQLISKMALKMLNPNHMRLRAHHSVRFTGDEIPKYKSLESSDSSPNYPASTAFPGPDSGAPSPDGYQPAAQRFRVNEQRIKLLNSINTIVQQRCELESNRLTLSNLLDELRRKLKKKVEECHLEKKDKMKSLKQSNQRLEKEKIGLVAEIEHLKRHLIKEEAHHVQHARTAVAQAIQGVTKVSSDTIFSPCSVTELPNVVCRNVARNAPSRVADTKLAAARLMRDIAELRQRVGQVETRLANEMKRKRQAELDIVRLRKELSHQKTCVASLRMPPPPLRKQCSKFA